VLRKEVIRKLVTLLSSVHGQADIRENGKPERFAVFYDFPGALSLCGVCILVPVLFREFCVLRLAVCFLYS